MSTLALVVSIYFLGFVVAVSLFALLDEPWSKLLSFMVFWPIWLVAWFIKLIIQTVHYLKEYFE